MILGKFVSQPSHRSRRWRDRLLLDPVDWLRRRLGGGRDLPPASLRRWVGAGDFVAEGRWFVDELLRRGLLPAGGTVLDLGCGCGRLAFALARDPRTSVLGLTYWGMDVDVPCVRWCQRHLAAARRGFHFYRADLRSSSYNPAGRETAADYRFPHPDAAFDLILAASLFTHLPAEALARFLAESARLLRPGGALYATLFLLAEKADPHRHPVAFPFPAPPCAYHRERVPEEAVAVEERWFLARAAEHGLALDGTIAYGMQDHLVLKLT